MGMARQAGKHGPMWPWLAVGGAGIALILGAQVYFARIADDAALRRDRSIVETGIAGRIQEIADKSSSVAIWDDAVLHLDNKLDDDWANSNIGTYFRDNGFNAALVLNSEGVPLYQSATDGRSAPGTADLVAAASALVAKVRQAEAARGPAGAVLARQQSISEAINASATSLFDGRLFILNAALVQPDFGKALPATARSAIILSAMEVDDDFVSALSGRFLLADAHLHVQQLHAGQPAAFPDLPPGEARAVLSDGAGKAVAVFDWEPPQPGRSLLSQTLLPILAGLIGLAAWAVLLFARGRKATERLIASEAKAVLLASKLEANQETLRAMLADLTAAKNAAESASVAKSQFLANMSHEIRTPLNGVLGLAQVMASEKLEPEHAEKIDLILDAGKSLLVLLNDVLDLSKIEAGKLEITTAPGDLMHTIGGTVQLFRAQAEGKGLRLTLDAPNDIPRMHYDLVRVRQCVSNLISNAIKFTSDGTVAVTVSIKPHGGAEYMILVQVRDTGIGMDEAAMSRLFTAFTQGDNSTTRRFGGTGLGLAISRALARAMGGDIRVRSKESVGSSFALWFRAEEAPIEIAKPVAAVVARTVVDANEPLRGARILVTDDNALNRRIIRMMLAPHGCEITEAANGQEALDHLAAQTFDLVLLDAHMPVMDGVEAIRRIRTSHEYWRTLPVIALTADAMAGDREKYLAMGMSEYLSKPVDKRALIATMSGLLVPGSQAIPVLALTGT
jgi:signal transduction histidine kinase/ActR/RegA family two-component response regulator